MRESLITGLIALVALLLVVTFARCAQAVEIEAEWEQPKKEEHKVTHWDVIWEKDGSEVRAERVETEKDVLETSEPGSYQMKVRAWNKAGASDYTKSDTLTLTDADVTVPSSPYGIKIKVNVNVQVEKN